MIENGDLLAIQGNTLSEKVGIIPVALFERDPREKNIILVIREKISIKNWLKQITIKRRHDESLAKIVVAIG